MLEANLVEFEALKLGIQKYVKILDSHAMEAVRAILESYTELEPGSLSTTVDFSVRESPFKSSDSVVPLKPARIKTAIINSPSRVSKDGLNSPNPKKVKRLSKKEPPKVEWPKKSKKMLK